jgi:hypothetical protein
MRIAVVVLGARAATLVGYWLEPGETSASSAHPVADAGSIIPRTS